MMGSEIDNAQQTRLFVSTDAMESLDLGGDLTSHGHISNSGYRGITTSLDDYQHHPLTSPRYHRDPLQVKSSDFLGKTQNDSPQNSGSKDHPLIDPQPPLYADTIFSSYEEDSVLNGSFKEVKQSSSSSTAAFPSSSIGEFIDVSVTQPQKEQESGSGGLVGSGSFVTYLITTRTNIPEYGGTEFSVRRRFKDVVILADRLAETHRGYFVPPRPDKSIVESQVMQKRDFIEQRIIALQKYFSRLCRHPIVRKSGELRVFLQSHGKLPLMPTIDMASRMLDGAVNLPRQLFSEGSAVITPQDAVQPAKGGRDLLRLFKELKQSVANDWGRGKPAIMEEDKDFLDKKANMEELEHQLTAASQQVEVFIKAQRKLAETMGDFGLAFIKLGKFEAETSVFNSQRTHEVDAKRLATAAVKASRCYREANAQSAKHLDQVHEYLGLMQAVHAAFEDRTNALLTVQTLVSDLSSMNAKVEKLSVAASKVFGGDKSRNRKIEELNDAIKVTEESRTCATREYDRIKENNRTELERFEQERRRGFYEMLKGFANNQVAYADNISNLWVNVAEESSNYARPPDSPLCQTQQD